MNTTVNQRIPKNSTVRMHYSNWLDWDQRLPPPAAKTAVQTLPVVIIAPEQVDKGLKCPVCLLEFEEQETVREMPCKHLFHSGCILPWLGKTNSCPLCRLELPTDNPEYEDFKKDKVGEELGLQLGHQNPNYRMKITST
ncbi:E3 ubiquitin-protein ligase RNF181 isoform X3 [Esox lucius]|uniref:E3 ubiquitin-protein ligase RNF181 isoform X3 n=1 Tax=Esox lucius TaxID=8010 RepID=UPI0014770A66|nr:E3 ubiquitin-protein ligase RNF181 isoform X3 [Esox lucius]